MSSSDEKPAEKTLRDGSRVGAPDDQPLSFNFPAIVLDKIDPNLFVAQPDKLWKPPGARAVYGGQVVGQALSAASQTVAAGLSLHSLHAYFVRAGQPEHPIVYDVKRVRDGKTFATRLVNAKQNAEWIFIMQASFQRPEASSLAHQALMPKVPAPESLPTLEERYRRLLDDPALGSTVRMYLSGRAKETVMETRVVLDEFNWSSEEGSQMRQQLNFANMGMPSQVVWVRARSRLPDDEHVHHSVLAFRSDGGLLSTARGAVDFDEFLTSKPMQASLDHSMWFHQAFPRWRADEWLLYVTYSPRMVGTRGLSHGHIFTQDGCLVVSCTQEGLIRLATDRVLNEPADARSKM